MRFFRRNALGIYATYAAAIVSGLVVTPIVLHELGTEAFGIWSFIASITVYLMVLDFGVGPSIVRFAAEARGRRSPEDTNALASVGLALYGVIGVATLPVGLALAWLVPELVSTPADLVWPARISTFLVVLGIAFRFPLGLFNNLLLGQQRFDLQNLANFRLDRAVRGPRRDSDPAGRGPDPAGGTDPGHDTAQALASSRLAALRATRVGLSRLHVTRARMRELTSFSWSNFLVHLANTVVFSTDVVVVGIVLGPRRRRSTRSRRSSSARYGPWERRHAAALPGALRVRRLARDRPSAPASADRPPRRYRGDAPAGAAAALPPRPADRGMGGEGYGESAAVMALLALVALVHQPIYLLTQFLIARARQQEIAQNPRRSRRSRTSSSRWRSP